MGDRLFSIDEIPQVPLFREPRRAKAARGIAIDARFANDYPADWHRCGSCNGVGWAVSVLDAQREPFLNEDGSKRGDCTRCLAMGSLKARVRFEAGHRCIRCGHPYVPKGDAAMLGLEPTSYQWSRCDWACTHGDPIRFRPLLGETWLEAFLEELIEGDAPATAGELVSNLEVPMFVEAEWRILTVHHLDGDKANCQWWNLAALCQRCHLEIQAKVVMERIWPHEHSEWFKPYVAGYYAHVYLAEDLARDQVDARLDELLALERAA